MTPDPRKIAISEHQRWLGYLQPEGLVVSPLALADSQVQLDTGSYAAIQARLIDALSTDPGTGRPTISNFAFFARDFLGWKDELLSVFSVSAEVPDGLRISTGEHGEILQPDAAYRYFHPADPAKPWLILVRQLDAGAPLDEIPDGKKEKGWVATPHQKFERLLRETGVPIGVLCNGHSVRLTYAPKGENSGSITFPVAFMTEIAGRAVASALDLLLSHRRLIVVAEGLRLPALLRKSRDYQAEVSTRLSGQVLQALYELGRGFQGADEKSGGTLLAETWQRDPQEIYGGFISTLLRLVFLLYAEDRGLMPSGELYQRNYSVQGLFERLRNDHERYPDTMDDRFAGWPRLLALFRAIHGGCRHRSMSLPARRGHLFDPDRFPFLEGRTSSQSEVDPLHPSIPRVSDGTLHRVLDLLLYLDGERLSYRTLDVEQIGSVYETIMGFEVQKATGFSIALKPKKAHGAPVHLDLDTLLVLKPADREKTLVTLADTKLPDAAAKTLKSASSLNDLLAALDKRVDRRATPHPVPAGSIILQPTDERRRSGSHYTPRSFTEPIVRKTLEPILDLLGRHPRPEVLLGLKVADIAVGSAAFLVETCRQLADELASSWHYHKCLPVVPPDEDELLYARRLVAQRCLYGVDRNPMAVDLAKLSLWLATMAQDHPFTFVDHAIKCGDSLVGLTNQQIAAFHWDPAQAENRIFGQEKLEQQIANIAAERKRILDWTEDTEAAVLKKCDFLAAADSAAQSLKTTGDLVIAAFFAGEKVKARQQNRNDFLHRHLELQKGDARQLPWQVSTLKQLRGGEHPVRTFHWEIEFPEVFSRENPGFDGIVGNPPYAGKNTMLGGNRDGYLDWLKTLHRESHGNADLVAHFFRRGFTLLRRDGTFGLIATNTIRQGDTRHSGLRWICVRGGGTIYAARRRYKWAGTAAVTVSVVWVVKGTLPAPFDLDGKSVRIITAYLFHDGGHENPAVLAANAGRSFVGSYVLGMGFTFDDADKKGAANPLAEMERLITKDPHNAERIFPYIGGEELNDSPTHSHRRYVINFADFPLRRAPLDGKTWKHADGKQRDAWLRTSVVPEDYPESVAADWPDLLDIVERKVKPEREKLGNDGDALRRKKHWWLWGRYTPGLFAAIEGCERMLVTSLVTHHLSFSFLPTNLICSKNTAALVFDSFAAFAVIHSRAHEGWSRAFSSTLEDRLNYTPSDCFETFPFPVGWETDTALEAAGRDYYEHRAELMVSHGEGLTKTYNHFHTPPPEVASPEIQKLRALHSAMDRAVLDAYGWSDIPTTCEFLLDYEEDEEGESEASTSKKSKTKKPYRYRWPDEVRDEVLARLLTLNAVRAEHERLSGGIKKTAKKAIKKIAPTQVGHGSQIELFPTPEKAAARAPSVKKRVTPGKKTTGYKSGFARQLVAAEILWHCHEEPTMGRVKLQKLIHLSEYHARITEIEGNYQRAAAGPFDNQLMFGVVNGLKTQKWFEVTKHEKGTRYTKLSRAGGHTPYLGKLQCDQAKLQDIIRVFQTAKTDQCEIVSTLYAAWNDLLIEGVDATDEQIIEQASSAEYWHKNKESIAAERWPLALSWMRSQGIVPSGWGAHTRHVAVTQAQAIATADRDDHDFFTRGTETSITDWRERVAAFSFDLPSSGRPVEPVALFYYRIVIPALLQEAGGLLGWEELHTAASLLCDRDLLIKLLPETAQGVAQKWARKFKSPTGPDAFGTALQEAILTSRKISITGPASNLELRLVSDVRVRLPWFILDARLALTAATYAADQGVTIPAEPELTEKLWQLSQTA